MHGMSFSVFTKYVHGFDKIVFVQNGGYEVEFFSEDEDKHILLQRLVLNTNSVHASFVPLELTSIFTRWHL